jgi:cytochrome b pre-mRNA-processing protein 3
MILKRFFAAPPARIAGEALYAAAARQSRQPEFYRDIGVPDSGEGRFELYCLHVSLIVIRLKGQGAVAAETSQHLFDTFLQALDDALREMGVGDLSVGKKMRKLGAAFYGRGRAYEEALEKAPDPEELETLLARTVLGETSAAGAPALADYVLRAFEALRGQPLDALLEGRAQWPERVL